MNRKGFTLIELIMVIVVIGIMAAVVAPRLGSVSTSKAAAFREKLRADIRYAQNLAMTQNRRYRVYFNGNPAPNPGYAVVNDSNANSTWGEAGEFAMDPASGTNLSIALNTGKYEGITAASTVNPIEFNTLGKPTGGATTVTVSPGGYTVAITAETGAVN